MTLKQWRAVSLMFLPYYIALGKWGPHPFETWGWVEWVFLVCMAALLSMWLFEVVTR